VTTPGVIEIRSWKLRPLSGMFWTNFRLITALTDPSVVLIEDAPASTVTLSDLAPIGKVKFSTRAVSTFKTMSGLIRVLNPAFEI
jgi:hypothetical protein